MKPMPRRIPPLRHLTSPLASLVLGAAGISAAQPLAAQASTTPKATPQPSPKVVSHPESKAMNPFLQPSPLPYKLPPFDLIRVEHFRPAFEVGFEQEREEIAAITRNPQPPTFQNTIVAMERGGRTLSRVSRVFFNLVASDSNPELQKIETEMAPRITAHRDSILMNAALFARVDTLFSKRLALGLDAESLQLLERTHAQFVRAGARLPEADKARLRAINEELSSLQTRFQQNVLQATKDSAVIVESVDELRGMPAAEVSGASATAQARGLKGKWLLPIQNTTIQPVLAQLENRALRRRIYEASIQRAQKGENSNLPVVSKLVRLRAEAARLLGYPTYAAYVLEDQGAATPKAVNDLLSQLAPAAALNARNEAQAIQEVIDAEAKAAGTPSFKVEPWDWAFYSEKVRKAKYAFDEAQVRPYLELDRVLKDGVFYAASQLYGITFRERRDLPVYHPDVRVFEIFDADGAPLALFLTDFFARDSKQGGAWMDAFVEQTRLLEQKPVVTNNLNIPKPAPGQPALLTFDEVTTMFHEFGHALHGLFSNANYPTVAGTNVPSDFVEFPSQYNEMWACDPAVLAHYAKHHQTGEALPQPLLEKVLAAQKFNQGFATTEYLAAAMLDQAWHTIEPAQAPEAERVMDFERAALKRFGLDLPFADPRYRSPYFSHAFSGGYFAQYYAYLWSEVLARDTEQWMRAHGGLQRANGDFLRAKVLSRGRTAEPSVLFEQFYGRAPEIGPLLEHRGLVLPKTTNP